MRRALFQLSFLLTLCALITLPNLAAQGLTNSEAHRVIPALEMLNTGDYLVPHMFSQPYLRKPQLTPWLFAAALNLHNDPTLTPRLVSALCFTLTVLASFFFARRWFGNRAGFPAAIALTLTPLYWSPARAAEIESLNNLLTALAAWLAIDLINKTKPHNSFKHKLPTATLLIITALLMLLTKGPAGFPILLSLLLSTAILNRSIKSFFNLSILLPVALAAALFAWFWSITLAAAGPDAIVQSPNAFMFEADKFPKLAGFIPVSLLTALPITGALLFPWGKDAKAEASQSEQLQKQLHTAKLIALSIPLALLIMNITGVSNDRYAQPILITAAPLTGWLLTIYSTGTLQPHRQKIFNTITLGSPKILATILAALAILYITTIEPANRATSGKQPALKLAEDLQTNLPPLPPNTRYILVADAMIEARPETLLYLHRALKNTDHQLQILWLPNLPPERLTNLNAASPTPLLALIRTDPPSKEPDKVLPNKVIATGTVHEFDFSLVILQMK